MSDESSLAVIDVEPTELVETEEPRKNGKRLTHGEIHLALTLRDEGLSQVAIAKRLNTTQATISRLLAQWQDTRVLAKAVIKKRAKKLAEKLCDTADANQILEVFDREGILEKKRDTQESNRIQVMIGVKLPGVGEK